MAIDVPAFSHRGFMLDVSRHFMPAADIRLLLRAANALGLNRMHWHLTDDQGWRIEIRKYPRLTGVGARRGHSFFGGVSETEHNDGFYTQEEIRGLVSYAQSLGVEIVPEIEIPGHAAAMLAAYPEFGCTDPRTGRPWRGSVEIAGGIFPALLCAGKPSAFDFIRDVLDEVMALFPAPMFHIGGDEALKLRWRRCPDCQRRMRETGVDSEDALQRRLVLDIGDYLAAHGRRTVVWSDVLAGGMLPDHFIVQHWIDPDAPTRAFMQNGGSVIYSDTRYCYLDYPYGAIDVRRVWEMPRVPAFAAGCEDRLLGIECPLWTERVTNLAQAARRLFPRLAAMSVRMTCGDLPWPEFLERVKAAEARVEALGLHGAPEALWHMSEGDARADRERYERQIHAEEALPFVAFEEGVTLLERTERFMLALGIPRAFALKAGDAALARLYGESALNGNGGAAELIDHMMRAVKNREAGCWKDLPEDVWLDTMRCFPRFISEHRRTYGRDGFDRAFWTTRQVDARLFRIGTLEYEPLPDVKEIAIHIPSDADLSPDALNDSVNRARAFFEAYFPDRAGDAMTCETWLLHPSLKALLPESSRILRFQAAFDIRRTNDRDDEAVEWIFHTPAGRTPVADLPEDTTLQRNMKARLLRGAHPGCAYGALVRPFE